MPEGLPSGLFGGLGRARGTRISGIRRVRRLPWRASHATSDGWSRGSRPQTKIDQRTRGIRAKYEACLGDAAEARKLAYAAAVETLRTTAGWDQLDDEQQTRIAEPLASRAGDDVLKTTPIPQIRAETDACAKRLQDAVEQVLRAVDGTRMVQVHAGAYFRDGIETEEQLDNSLSGLREECIKLVGEGKKVFLK